MKKKINSEEGTSRTRWLVSPRGSHQLPSMAGRPFSALGGGGGSTQPSLGELNPLATTFCESDAIIVVVIYAKKFWGTGWLHCSVLRGVSAAAPAGGPLLSAWRSGL